MENNWQFHDTTRIKGRPIALLNLDELTLALPILRKRTTVQYIHNHKEYFHRSDSKFFEQNLSQAKERINQLLRQYRNASNFDNDVLSLLNMDLQQTFSDLGWISFRREYSQAKKRQTKNRIELSNNVAHALRKQMDLAGWSNVDQALTTLLKAYNPHIEIPELTSPIKTLTGELKNHWTRTYVVDSREHACAIEIKGMASAESLLQALITSLLNSDYIEFAIFGSELTYGYKKPILRVIKGKRIYLKTTINGRQKVIGQHAALSILSNIELC